MIPSLAFVVPFPVVNEFTEPDTLHLAGLSHTRIPRHVVRLYRGRKRYWHRRHRGGHLHVCGASRLHQATHFVHLRGTWDRLARPIPPPLHVRGQAEEAPHVPSRHCVQSRLTHRPAIWMRGELCIPDGPLPAFIDSMTIEDAVHDLPEGARLACIKCVSAWRMGHLDTTSLREYLRSFAWQSSALQQCAVLAPARVGNTAGGGRSSEETSDEEPCELLSEEEMRSMMCGCDANPPG
ncbi:hypothetical protein T484DRAFT_2178972, partial [Baffinella frigidus]